MAGLVLAGMAALWSGHSQAQGIAKTNENSIGMFEGHGDVGEVGAAHRGSLEYDAGKETYTIAGGGENMWFGKDAFQFAWKRVSGNVTLTADIAFVGAGKNPHRKAVLMVRQSLDADSAYADVAVHGEGLTSLQFREAQGGTTHEVQANVSAPKRVRLVKRGGYYTMFVAGEDGKFVLAGASPLIDVKEPFYVGIGVCSHEKDVVEKAVFSKLDLRERPSQGVGPPTKLYSLMEIISADSGDRRAIYVAEGRFEAPNWMPDGKRLLFNRNGKIETIEVTGGATQKMDTGFLERCNNDHGISPDGKWLVVSDHSQNDVAVAGQSRKEGQSVIYVLPIGGQPRRVTKNAPSYWHGWSPDGKTLAFVGERGGEFDIYTIPVSGGEETRLTEAKGLDDGPEYTPDGKYLYFNSERTGYMQIWKMKADGGEQEQVTFGPENDWFPHFSPDGSRMVFLTYDPSVQGHPENKDVQLRMMSMSDGKITELAKLYGGQGTLNVPSWSPDGKRFAFVSYAWVEEEGKQ